MDGGRSTALDWILDGVLGWAFAVADQDKNLGDQVQTVLKA
jgi:hypothetical protein